MSSSQKPSTWNAVTRPTPAYALATHRRDPKNDGGTASQGQVGRGDVLTTRNAAAPQAGRGPAQAQAITVLPLPPQDRHLLQGDPTVPVPGVDWTRLPVEVWHGIACFVGFVRSSRRLAPVSSFFRRVHGDAYLRTPSAAVPPPLPLGQRLLDGMPPRVKVGADDADAIIDAALFVQACGTTQAWTKSLDQAQALALRQALAKRSWSELLLSEPERFESILEPATFATCQTAAWRLSTQISGEASPLAKMYVADCVLSATHRAQHQAQPNVVVAPAKRETLPYLVYGPNWRHDGVGELTLALSRNPRLRRAVALTTLIRQHVAFQKGRHDVQVDNPRPLESISGLPQTVNKTALIEVLSGLPLKDLKEALGEMDGAFRKALAAFVAKEMPKDARQMAVLETIVASFPQ